MSDPKCACGHYRVSHHLTRGKKRTWCRVWNVLGPCGCKLFEEVPDVPRRVA